MRQKWLTVFFGVVFVIALTALAQADVICYGGHQYFLTDQAYSWEGAEAYAQNHGGHLVAINSAAEQAFIEGNFYNNKQYWIGATDKDVEGTWVWSSGEAFNYTNWYPGEPNNIGNEDYGTIWRFYPVGKWNDESSNCYIGIVEIPTCPAPIPGSLLLLGSALLPVLGLRRLLQ